MSFNYPWSKLWFFCKKRWIENYLYIQNGQISGKPQRVWKTKGEWWLWINIRDDRLQIPLHTWELTETTQRKKIPTRSFSWWDFFVDNNSELINLKIWRQLGIGCLQNIKQVYLMSRILMFNGIAYRSFCVSVEIVWTTGNTEVGIIVHVYWYEVAYPLEFLLVFVMVYHTSWWKLEGETP